MSYDENFSALCADANRIAAQLRGGQPLIKQVKLNPTIDKKEARRLKYKPLSGVRGKGAYLKEKKLAILPEVLAFCHEFFASDDQLPPQQSVALRFGVREQTAQDYMNMLRDAGHIERNSVGRWRFARGQR